MMKKYYVEVFLLVALIASVVVVGVVAQQKMNAQNKVTALIAENIALTKAAREAKVDAYKDGIIFCGNEDVDYLNGLADEYSGNALGRMFKQMAMTWAYEDEDIEAFIEEYMDEGSN